MRDNSDYKLPIDQVLLKHSNHFNNLNSKFYNGLLLLQRNFI